MENFLFLSFFFPLFFLVGAVLPVIGSGLVEGNLERILEWTRKEIDEDCDCDLLDAYGAGFWKWSNAWILLICWLRLTFSGAGKYFFYSRVQF